MTDMNLHARVLLGLVGGLGEQPPPSLTAIDFALGSKDEFAAVK